MNCAKARELLGYLACLRDWYLKVAWYVQKTQIRHLIDACLDVTGVSCSRDRVIRLYLFGVDIIGFASA